MTHGSEPRSIMQTIDLFDRADDAAIVPIGHQACVLRGFAQAFVPALLPSIAAIERAAPLRHMTTPGGFDMSVAMTNCGALGWTTDRSGYRYTGTDPVSRQAWPDMPEVFARLAHGAAALAGFAAFHPDACLVNRYAPGARLSLHQDRNERDFGAPIVSVSLGMSATFLWGGHGRSDPTAKIPLEHGDVVVWGGEDRLRYHGVLPLKGLPHPLLGEKRMNLTFRKAV